MRLLGRSIGSRSSESGRLAIANGPRVGGPQDSAGVVDDGEIKRNGNDPANLDPIVGFRGVRNEGDETADGKAKNLAVFIGKRGFWNFEKL